MQRLRADDGLSTLELGLVLPMFLLLLMIVMPVIDAGREYVIASRAVAHGIRYATRVDSNPRVSPDGTLTRRPSASEVEALVTDAATELELFSVDVTPEPSSSLSGDLITLRVTYRTTFWSNEITVTARGREE
ncbi:MAG: hypothetical protein WD826_02715 [Actinomycetota bacterium]